MSKKIRNRRRMVASRYLDKLAEKESSPAYQSTGGSFTFSDQLYNKWICGRYDMTLRRRWARDRREYNRTDRIPPQSRRQVISPPTQGSIL